MKKIWLIIGSLAFFQFFAKSQQKTNNTDSVDKTAIELVYNHYIQDGNNSAVTGGIGTEKLTIYGPQVGIQHMKGKHNISNKFGVDIISSASTDNIDFVVSSASVLDARGYANVVYENRQEEKNLSVFGGGGASMESDYLSWHLTAGINKSDAKGMADFMASISFYNDDLRWGRLTDGYLRPVRLIYPEELRYREWYDGYNDTL